MSFGSQAANRERIRDVRLVRSSPIPAGYCFCYEQREISDRCWQHITDLLTSPEVPTFAVPTVLADSRRRGDPLPVIYRQDHTPMRIRLTILLCTLLVATGCSDDSSSGGDAGSSSGTDAGAGDTGPGPADTGAGPADTGAGPADTGAGPDGVDTGSVGVDTGAGDIDTGPGEPTDTGPAPTPAEAVAAWIEGLNATTAQTCECYLAETDYETAESCTQANSFNDDVAACFVVASVTVTPGLAVALACFAQVEADVAACFDEDCERDCYDEFGEVAAGCPEPSESDFEDLADAVGACLTGDTPSPCPENEEAITETGDAVITGTTAAGGDDSDGSCAGFPAADRAYAFQATAAGNYVFDTHGSSFDTLIYVLDGCGGEELGCVDDPEELAVLTSEVSVALEADQTVILVIDGFDQLAAGDFVVNITPPE